MAIISSLRAKTNCESGAPHHGRKRICSTIRDKKEMVMKTHLLAGTTQLNRSKQREQSPEVSLACGSGRVSRAHYPVTRLPSCGGGVAFRPASASFVSSCRLLN